MLVFYQNSLCRTAEQSSRAAEWSTRGESGGRKERLLTHDRLKKWGSYDMMVCGLCMRCEESHDHLFFQCEYSKAILSKIQTKMACVFDAHSWKDMVGILADKPCFNNIWSIIRRLCLGAAIYFIWQEKNFRSQKRDWTVVMQLVFDSVKTSLVGLSVKKSTAVKNAADM
ncbi:RNA-directed DNA polymerase, eukaryota, reverse transcriptase zinc-binding domain protein [Tanacetum coccineum]